MTIFILNFNIISEDLCHEKFETLQNILSTIEFYKLTVTMKSEMTEKDVRNLCSSESLRNIFDEIKFKVKY